MQLRKYVPHGVVFVTSMGVMIVELIASRIVAKHFGNSLYTWTGIIGVVLGGISLGNYLGGRLADRFEPRRMIVFQLLLTSVLIMLILPLDALLYLITMEGQATIITSQMIAKSIFWIVLLFLLPSAAIGTVSPVMAKYALEESTKVGNTVGGIYAVSSIGSIIGTFLAGYLLIPLLGVRIIVFLVAGLIALLGLLMSTGLRYRIAAAAWIAVVVALGLLFPDSASARAYYEAGGGKLLFAADSQYMNIEVRDVPKPGGMERQLIMDGLIHNRYDLSNPDVLRYEYERIFESLTRYYTASVVRSGAITTLTIGGGAMIFPDFLARHYPKSRTDVVEIDPEVVRVAKKWFTPAGAATIGSGGSAGVGLLSVFNTDGRNYVNYARSGPTRYDIVYLDAFNSFSIPAHLTTREFAMDLLSMLRPEGYVVANCIDVYSLGKFIAAYVRTLQSVFRSVTVYADTVGRLDQRMTFVVVGGNAPLGPATLADQDGAIVGRRLSDEEVANLLERNPRLVLTDDHAPVENLMAPVFLHSVH
ncbi:MAG TPA: fused MFS/spermidine synthase [Spirochaetia bacterium]|nr:fused MFS/spermidine synthase [Spirochaetia bacterium]